MARTATRTSPSKRSRSTAKSTAKSKPTSTRSARLAALYSVELPRRLARFFDSDEWRTYEGRSIYGLAGFSSDSKLPVRFASKHTAEIWDAARSGLSLDPATHFPVGLAGADGLLVLADLTQPDLPVQVLDHQGGLKPYAPSFKAFLAGLLQRGQKTPTEELWATYEAALKHHKADRHRQVLQLLLPAARKLETHPVHVALDGSHELPGSVFNLVGLTLKTLGRIDDSIAWLEKASARGSSVARLNLCDLYLNHFEDYSKLITYAEALKGDLHLLLDAEGWFHARNYLGEAYLATGREDQAVLQYHDIRTAFADRDASKVKRSIKDLREYVTKEKPNHEIASRILSWLDGERPAAPTPEEAARNRAWWTPLPDAVKERLCEAVKARKRPDDAQLAAILRLTRVDLSSIQLEDLGFLQAFERLGDLDLARTGIGDLSFVKAHPRLVSLYVDRNAVRTLKPLRSLRALQRLSCKENELKSLEGIESLHRLQDLDASENRIRDLRPLRGLLELEELSVEANAITDLSPLEACAGLKTLRYSENPIKRGEEVLEVLRWVREVAPITLDDPQVEALQRARPYVELSWGGAAPLAESGARELRAWWKATSGLGDGWKPALLKLVKEGMLSRERAAAGQSFEPTDEQLWKLVRRDALFLGEARLRTLEPIRAFRWADYLKLTRNGLTDLSPLEDLPLLRELLADENQIESVEPLGKLLRLEVADLAGNRLRSLRGLERCGWLRELSIDENEVDSLEPLRRLARLRELYASRTPVSDLSPLAGMKELQRVAVYGTRVKDLSPLAGCEGLEVVECFANPGITGLMALRRLPRLMQVVSHHSLPAAELEAFRKVRPDVEVD